MPDQTNETPTPSVPYPHAWTSALVGTVVGGIVAAIGMYLVVAHVSSRPVDLRPLTQQAIATIDDRLAANRIPSDGVAATVVPVTTPSAWFDYSEYSVSVPGHLDADALRTVIRKSLQAQGVSVDVGTDESGATLLQLGAAGNDIGSIRLIAERNDRHREAWPAFKSNEVPALDAAPAAEPEPIAMDDPVRTEPVRIQLPTLDIPKPVATEASQVPSVESEGSESTSAEEIALDAASAESTEMLEVLNETSTVEAADAPVTEPNEPDKEAQPADLDGEQLAEWSPSETLLPEFESGHEMIDKSSRMRVAIIVDDGGYGGSTTDAILALDPKLTLSILPYTPHARDTSKRAAERGFELMLHMPMENLDPNLKHDGQINVGMSPARIHALTLRALDYVPGAKGVNNHMGSRFTADRFFIDTFLEGIEDLDLYFVDSRTTSNSVAYDAADRRGIASVYRHIFLDHDNDVESIEKQFAAMIDLAEQQGDVVAIAHFRPNTVEVLERMLPELQRSGIALVHASEILQ